MSDLNRKSVLDRMLDIFEPLLPMKKPPLPQMKVGYYKLKDLSCRVLEDGKMEATSTDVSAYPTTYPYDGHEVIEEDSNLKITQLLARLITSREASYRRSMVEWIEKG